MAKKQAEATQKRQRDEMEALAMEFQTEANKIKLMELENEKKKQELIAFVDDNPQLMTDNKFKFECGVMVSKTFTEKLQWSVSGKSKDSMENALLQKLTSEFKVEKLDEPTIIAHSKSDSNLSKLLDSFKCSVSSVIAWRVNK